MNSEYGFTLKKQVSTIKNTIDVMLKNAEYGNHQNFLQNIRRISDAASKIELQLNAGIPIPNKKKYGKILVPYDSSEYSKKALVEATDMAEWFSSELYVINVINIPTDESPSMIQGITSKKLKKLNRDVLGSQKTHVSKILQEKMKTCKRLGINVFYDVIIGKPADSILKFAKENKIDLIVIGSKGLTKFNRLMALGSVSRKISEEARCPVMIVR